MYKKLKQQNLFKEREREITAFAERRVVIQKDGNFNKICTQTALHTHIIAKKLNYHIGKALETHTYAHANTRTYTQIPIQTFLCVFLQSAVWWPSVVAHTHTHTHNTHTPYTPESVLCARRTHAEYAHRFDSATVRKRTIGGHKGGE